MLLCENYTYTEPSSSKVGRCIVVVYGNKVKVGYPHVIFIAAQ